MPRMGVVEYLIIAVIILIYFLPIALVGVLVRNFLQKRRAKESQKLQVEIDRLKEQVAALESRKP